MQSFSKLKKLAPEVFYKKNSQNSQESTCARVSFLIKLQARAYFIEHSLRITFEAFSNWSLFKVARKTGEEINQQPKYLFYVFTEQLRETASEYFTFIVIFSLLSVPL